MAASGGYDNTVRIWDVASRVLLGDPIRLRGSVPLGGIAFAELVGFEYRIVAVTCSLL
jgi:hypothetical protein